LQGTSSQLGGDKLKRTVLIYLVGNETQWELPYYAEGRGDFQKSKKRRPVVRFFSEKEVVSRGGVDDLEDDLGEKCDWYARIGSIQLPATKGRRVVAPPAAVSSLFDDWVACGRPRELGWRYKHIELYSAAEKALMIALGPKEHPVGYEVNSLTPDLHEIPNILQRLEASEIVEVDVPMTVGFCYTDQDGLDRTREDDRNFHLSIWCEKTVNDFKVKAKAQREKAPQHPGDQQISNLKEQKEKE
jgi:hypothetical protein